MSWGPKQQPNGSWRVGWDNPPHPDGRRNQETATFKTEDEATTFKITLDYRHLHGAYAVVDTRTPLATFARQVAASRRANTEHTPDVLTAFDRFIRDHLDDHPIGRLPLAKVTPLHVAQWTNERRARYAPRTLRHKVNDLAAIFLAAVDAGVLLQSPVKPKALKLPKPPKVRIPVITPEQVAQLADAMPRWHRAAVLTQAGMGLRVGELRGLRRADFHGSWLGDAPLTLHLESQLLPNGERAGLKTDTSARTVPVAPHVKAALQAHMVDFPPWDEQGGLIFYRTFTGHGRQRTQPPAKKGQRRPILGYGGTLVYQAGKLAATDPDFPAFPRGHGSHLLRYHFASYMVVATNGDLKSVANALGHADTTQLTKRYLQALADGENKIRAALTALWDGIAEEKDA